MSISYRMDGRKAVRSNVKGTDAVKNNSSLPSTTSPKRKSQSLSPSLRPSARSVCSDPDKDKQKKPFPPSSKPPTSQMCRLRNKPQTSQEHDKENSLPDDGNLIEQKRRDFLNFRKQLLHQQNTYIDMYAQLRDLEDQSGVTPGGAGEVRVLSVTDWPVHDLLMLTQNTPALPHAEFTGILGPKILQQMSCLLNGIPEETMALATELMARRLELVEFIRTLLYNDTCEGNIMLVAWQEKNAELDEETEKMHKLMLTTVQSFESKIVHSLDVAKIPWIDRDNMIKKIESLQKELSIYKTNKPDESATATQTDEPEEPTKLVVALENKTITRSSLKVQDAARAAMKEPLVTAEAKANAMRARCAELEKQLNETRVELASAQRRIDNLRQLNHYRSTNYETQSKKMEKTVSKTGELTIEVLSRQREALELRVRELQEEASIKSRDAETRETQLSARIETLRSKLDEQELNCESLARQVQVTEKRYKELQEQFIALQERSRDLIVLHNQKCHEYLPRKVQCSGEELEIWNDLQATKDALKRVKEDLVRSRADKDSLLNSLAKIAHEGPENKIAVELLSREEKISEMRNIIEELTEDKRKMEQDIACYQNQVSALRMEINVLRSLHAYECYNEEIPQVELETQVFNLYLQVESLTRERDALMTEAATRALALERHERCAELFAQVTRARRELAAQLEGNSAQSVFEGAPIHEVADAFSNAYLTSADIWSALRVERSRVLRLENTIAAQNRALDRENVVRVEHERRRAQLERELIRTWAGSPKGIKPIKKVEINELR